MLAVGRRKNLSLGRGIGLLHMCCRVVVIRPVSRTVKGWKTGAYLGEIELAQNMLVLQNFERRVLKMDLFAPLSVSRRKSWCEAC